MNAMAQYTKIEDIFECPLMKTINSKLLVLKARNINVYYLFFSNQYGITQIILVRPRNSERPTSVLKGNPLPVCKHFPH